MNLSDKDIETNFVYHNLSRREVRSLIFHLIYAIECFDNEMSLEAIADNFNRSWGLDIPMDCDALEVANGIVQERKELDAIIEPLLDNWRLERIGVCTKLILRLSMWELKHTDTPSSIVINEAIELAKCFSEKDAYRFVNGILDEACKIYRADEIQADEEEASDNLHELDASNGLDSSLLSECADQAKLDEITISEQQVQVTKKKKSSKKTKSK